MPLSLGIDVGTQGTKAIVYDTRTRTITGRGHYSYGLISKRPGQAEQSPSTWVQGVLESTQQALASVNRADVKAVGVSGQQHGLVVLDSNGEVIRDAKLWCDTETAVEAKELSNMFGTTIVPGFTAPKIMWLKKHEPEQFERVASILLPHDYINYWLTGELAMECGDASGTALMDVAGRCWNRKAMLQIDSHLPELFPPIIGPNTVVGHLTTKAAEQLGLSTDVIVSAGSGDNMMSALGAGAVRDGQLVISLGTSGTLFGKSQTPIIDPTGAIAPFCDATGFWLPLLCTLNCTGALEEVKSAWGLSHEELTAKAAEVPAGCGGMSFLPYLVGERTPNWPHASGVVLGLQPGSMQPGIMYRAAMEGATFGLLAGLKKMESLGLHPQELRIVGGGSKNPLWRQVVADIFQLPVRIPLETESAALGAALQAAAVQSGTPVAEYVEANSPEVSDEVVQPNRNTAAAYEAAFKRHLAFGEKLFAGIEA